METKIVYPEDRGEEFAETERYFYHCPISGIDLMKDIRLLDLPDELMVVNYSQSDEPIYVSDLFRQAFEEYLLLENHNDSLGPYEFLLQKHPKTTNLIKYRVIYPDGENEWTDFIYKF